MLLMSHSYERKYPYNKIRRQIVKIKNSVSILQLNDTVQCIFFYSLQPSGKLKFCRITVITGQQNFGSRMLILQLQKKSLAVIIPNLYSLTFIANITSLFYLPPWFLFLRNWFSFRTLFSSIPFSLFFFVRPLVFLCLLSLLIALFSHPFFHSSYIFHRYVSKGWIKYFFISYYCQLQI